MRALLRKCLTALLCLLILTMPARAAGRYAAVRLIAEGYVLDTEAMEAGGHALLTVTIANTSRYSEARNCKCTLEGGEAVIPDGAASVYVERIGREESAAFSFPVYVLPDAAPGWKRLSVSCEYEDDAGASLSSTEALWLEVRQPIRLAHDAVLLPARATEGANLAFQLDLMNMGKGTLYNVLLRFELPFLSAPQSLLAGELAPGATVAARTNLFVNTGCLGEASGTLTISCENAAGDRWEETVPLTTLVEKKPDPAPSTVEREEGPSLPAWLPGAAIAVAGTGAVIAIQVGIEKRRRRERDERLL